MNKIRKIAPSFSTDQSTPSTTPTSNSPKIFIIANIIVNNKPFVNSNVQHQTSFSQTDLSMNIVDQDQSKNSSNLPISTSQQAPLDSNLIKNNGDQQRSLGCQTRFYNQNETASQTVSNKQFVSTSSCQTSNFIEATSSLKNNLFVPIATATCEMNQIVDVATATSTSPLNFLDMYLAEQCTQTQLSASQFFQPTMVPTQNQFQINLDNNQNQRENREIQTLKKALISSCTQTKNEYSSPITIELTSSTTQCDQNYYSSSPPLPSASSSSNNNNNNRCETPNILDNGSLTNSIQTQTNSYNNFNDDHNNNSGDIVNNVVDTLTQTEWAFDASDFDLI
jgi:hypothetical protein